ncbi:lysyl oxidase family protein [Myxococcus sp. RHSTA-1-4]|uniref:lysyl oxidase family protein n=1 Tax=Myxococcus sp. RHSTA-1-4 TaxID=2874601 RepID=UPI001CBD4AE0|nr:lysyl oxidase family protein [Myxococcus sp. RHSTA-1-4]MBZ4417522.1 FG-GAP-like repeat-containing protein [Myxococcus sp. RHSTA-1-4]
MRLFRALSLSALMAVTFCACDDPDPTPDAGTDAGEPDAGAPDAGPGDAGTVLSETPVWEVEYDPAYTVGCFGRSLAMGDLNGDGRKDLAVVASPCLPTTQDPGRVSFFAGEGTYFSKQAVTQVMDWRNTSTRTRGSNMVVSIGNVDGDSYADLLVSGAYGALVFKGRPALGEVLSEVLFRAPGSGIYNNAVLADVTGDGLDDLVSVRLASVSVFRAQAGVVGEPFALVARTETLSGTSARRAGDVNGDGAQDLLVSSSTENNSEHRLYLGCKAGTELVCDGALTAQPVWTVSSQTLHLLPDLNGDGRPERFQGPGGGSLRLHLSDAQAEGGYSATPVWSLMEDPVFALLGGPLPVGDVDGDGHRLDFVMSSLGRLYYYSPGQAVSSELKPSWAWPRADSLPPQYEGFHRFAVLAPGDLDGNGFDDLVVGMSPPNGLISGPGGRVAIFAGGAVPATPTAPPYLPEEASCNLGLDPVNGKPDLTVDADVLARSLYVERRTFAAGACEVLEGCVPAAGERRLLRFSTSIVNLGAAAASVPNAQERPDLYVYDACHRHDHLTHFAGYALRDAQGNDVVQGRKQGFYLVDYHRQCSDAAPYFAYSERMGISAGWSDIYVADIPCQWIDITDLSDGTYTLRVGVDEQDIIEEASTHPNEAKLNVRIDGNTVTVLP